MTRTLLLIRHAEAARTPAGGADRDRPLTGFGIRQAEEIGRLIAAGVLPTAELAFCSTALRARSTWKTAEGVSGLTVPTVVDESLYSASYDAVVGLLREVPDEVEAVAVIGHAPEIPGLAHALTDARPSAAATYGWPAGGVGVAEVEGPWSGFPEGARLIMTRHIEPPD